MPIESLRYWRYWWDKGIFWIALKSGEGMNQVICMNSYQAEELYMLLTAERLNIRAQSIVDQKEFGKDE